MLPNGIALLVLGVAPRPSLAGSSDVFGYALATPHSAHKEDQVRLWVSDPGWGPERGSTTGLVWQYSTRAGKPILAIKAEQEDIGFGQALCVLQNGAAHGGCVVAIGSRKKDATSGRIAVYSCAEGALRHRTDLVGRGANPRSIAPLPDIDGDVVADYVVGLPEYSEHDKVIWEVPWNDLESPGLGVSLEIAGDCDRDGVPDAAVGGIDVRSSWTKGVVLLLSGKDGSPITRLNRPD